MAAILDPWTQANIVDPYPWYRQARPHSPFRGQNSAAAVGESTWNVLKFEQCFQVLRDHDSFSSRIIGGGADGGGMILIGQDPPRHTRMRGLVNRTFTPRRVAELEPWVTTVAASLLDQLDDPEPDLVHSFTVPLPVKVIARMLGIPGEEHERFKRWSDSFLDFYGADPATRMQHGWEMATFFGEMANKRRAEGAEDLITALVEAEVDGERLRDEEILGFCILLLIAGNETTTNLLSNFLGIVSTRPALWQRLRADRSLVEPAIEETLRFESPVQVIPRLAVRDAEIGGQPIREGEVVQVFFGAGNRDPEEFADAETFDVDRDLQQHIAFGLGIHYCLGSPVARLEARVAINQLLDRYASIEPAAIPGHRQSLAPVVFGYSSLPLRLVPA
jgi:cytochrome P450